MRYRLVLVCVLASGCVEYKEAETNASQGLMTTEASESSGTTTGTTTGSTGATTGSPVTTTTASATSATSSTTTTSTGTSASTTGPACSGPCNPDDPPEGLSCTENCDYDFSEVPQWFCGGTCTPIGGAVGGDYCDHPDADMFCKLRTGDPRATAGVWWMQTVTQPEAGFCCLDLVPEFGLGPIPLHDLEDLCYAPGDMSALPGHGTATVIVAEGLECMTP